MSTEGRVALQPAYILHRKPYRDTSLLIEAFSRDYGRVGLVARGTRGRRSSTQALLQPFQPRLLSWSGRGELQTLTASESNGVVSSLAGEAVLSGFYLNELLMRLLPRHDPHSDLYRSYSQTLQLIHTGLDNEWALRLFERDLLQELGYGLQLTHEYDGGAPLEPSMRYCYHPEFGPYRAQEGSIDCLAAHGETLLALNTGEPSGEQCRREAKRLMRAILQPYLGNLIFSIRHAVTRQNKSNAENEE